MSDRVRIAIAVPTAGLIVGCGLGVALPGLPPLVPGILLIACADVAFTAFACERPVLFSVGLSLTFAAGGAMLAQSAWEAAWRPTLRVAFESMARDERADAVHHGVSPPEDDSASATVVGVLRRDAAVTDGGGVSLDVDVRWIGRTRGPGGREGDVAVNPVRGGVLLTVVGAAALARVDRWRAGRTIRAPAQLHRPARYLDPGVPDQERVLARRGVSLVGSVKSGALVDVLARGGWRSESVAAARAFARRAIQDSVGAWSPRSAAIVSAIVIGDRTGLEDDVQRQLQEAGTYHVIAISGGNIAILTGLTLVAFRLAGWLGRAAMLSAVVGLLAYSDLVGGGASVDRATLMAVVYFLGRALDLRGPPANALVLVAGLMVVADPLSVADPAFLLTFGATAAILIVSSAVPMRGLPRGVAAIGSMFLASAAAEAALFPIGARLFSRVTLAGLALNFAAIPLMAVAQVAGMVLVPLYAASARLAWLVGWIAHVGAEGLVRSAGLVRLAPAVTWRVAPPSLTAIAVYYVAAAVSWTLWRRWRQLSGSAEPGSACVLRHLSAVAALASAMWIVAEPWTMFASRGDGRLHVTLIDVGQGDSALVRFPRGDTLLVDAGGLPGGSFDVGDRVVSPVLRDAGLRRLGTVAVTHGDADHAAGAAAAVAEFRPHDLWEGIPVPPLPVLQQLHRVASTVGSRWTTVQAGDELSVDDVRVVVRHPPRPDWERQRVRNDDSVVLELRWRDVSVVLTGDIGHEAEDAIGPDFEPAALRVVKVPHHGSLTSSSDAFVRRLAPTVAVVSVGRSNRFGHPAPEVLRRYASAGAAIFRTDQDGAVTVDSDGYRLDVRTFTGRHLTISAVNHEGTKDTKKHVE